MHMISRRLLMSFCLCLSALFIYGQDTLPNFTVVSKGNGRAIISWTNPFKDVKQISIQRSGDSTKNFKSIMTVADPELPQNGFSDTKALGIVYYRLFIVRDSGAYVFSSSKKPSAAKDLPATAVAPAGDSKQVQIAPVAESKVEEINSKASQPQPVPATPVSAPVIPVAPKPERLLVVLRNDSLINKVGERSLKRFRDSIITKTKDTMVFRSADTIQIKPFVPKEVYKASKYIYTEKDGNVAIALPEAGAKDYHIKFFEENNDPLFEIKQVKENYLLLEKANFLHSGWFRFEIFENGKLKEKQKLFIPREF